MKRRTAQWGFSRLRAEKRLMVDFVNAMLPAGIMAGNKIGREVRL